MQNLAPLQILGLVVMVLVALVGLAGLATVFLKYSRDSGSVEGSGGGTAGEERAWR